jgi:hypothetical protein
MERAMSIGRVVSLQTSRVKQDSRVFRSSSCNNRKGVAMRLKRLLRVGFAVAAVAVWVMGAETPQALANPTLSIKANLVNQVEGQGTAQVTLSVAVTNNDPDPVSAVSLALVSPADLTTSFGTISIGTLAPGVEATGSGTFSIPEQDLVLMGDLEIQNFRVNYTNVYLDQLSEVVKSDKMPEQTGP